MSMGAFLPSDQIQIHVCDSSEVQYARDLLADIAKAAAAKSRSEVSGEGLPCHKMLDGKYLGWAL